MVETATVYKCTVCWTTFLNRDEATRCEDSHSKISDLSIEYVVAERNKSFPIKMLVKDNADADILAVYVLDATGDSGDFINWREQELKKNL